MRRRRRGCSPSGVLHRIATSSAVILIAEAAEEVVFGGSISAQPNPWPPAVIDAAGDNSSTGDIEVIKIATDYAYEFG